MNRLQAQVAEFHKLYQVPMRTRPGFPPPDRIALRVSLIQEEAKEFREACEKRDFIEAADALGDLLVVTFGSALEFGLDMDPIMDEIHRSNKSKLGLDGRPIRREDGKILKGPNYDPPHLEKVIFP